MAKYQLGTFSTTVEAADLLKALQQLSKVQAKKAIRKGSRAAAKIVQAEAKRTAPKRTGTLAKSIKVRSLPRSRRYVGSTVKEVSDHAGFTEFGTKHSEGTHAIETAFKNVQAQAEATFLSVMKNEIEGMK